MDNSKIGQLISDLRKEKGLTQQELADALHITNKTISKWECGLGCPDVSLWADLSAVLGADLSQMMDGEMNKNKPDKGKLDKIRFFVCPSCHNILVSTGDSSSTCCGRILERQLPKTDENTPRVHSEFYDVDYFVTIDHEMTKKHYILFVAYVTQDKVFLTRLYPQQNAEVHIPAFSRGKLYTYCIRHGLSEHPVKL